MQTCINCLVFVFSSLVNCKYIEVDSSVTGSGRVDVTITSSSLDQLTNTIVAYVWTPVEVML